MSVPQPEKPLDPRDGPRAWLGAELRARRRAAGLSQAQLGKQVHVSADLIGRIETSDRRCSPDLAEALDAALGTGGVFTRALPMVYADTRSDADRTPSSRASSAIAPTDVARTLIREGLERFAAGPGGRRDVDALRALCQGLGIPLSEVGLANTDTRQGSDTNRRNFLAITAVAAASVPFADQYRESPVLPDLAELAGPTLAYRRIEARTSAQLLRPPVAAHLTLLRQLATTAEQHHDPAATRHLHTLVSETAGFAAWLATDADDRPSARTHYLLAIRAAERSEHALLTCYMRASLAQHAAIHADVTTALALVTQARRDLPAIAPPVAEAWLDCIEATIRASAGDETALRLLDSAARRLTGADPVWPWLTPVDTAKLDAYRDVVAVRLHRDLDHVTELPDPAASPNPKQAGATLAERAIALADLGDHERAGALALTVFDVGREYTSERLLRAVVTIRSRIGSHASSHTPALDARIASIYTED